MLTARRQVSASALLEWNCRKASQRVNGKPPSRQYAVQARRAEVHDIEKRVRDVSG